MEFNIRAVTKKDYDNILVGWWNEWGWTPPKREFLPNNGTGGIIVSKNNIDICAGFIYFTNSKVAWIEFVISNKDYREDDRMDAIEFLLASLSEIAVSEGYEFGYAVLKHKGLKEHYENVGFVNSDNNITEMLAVWQQQQL